MSIIEKAMTKAEQERSEKLAKSPLQQSVDSSSETEQVIEKNIHVDKFDKDVSLKVNSSPVYQDLKLHENINETSVTKTESFSDANTVKINPAPELIMASENGIVEGGSYRMLKEYIIALRKREPDKSIFMVTSPMKNEGKSIVSTNLACALATEFDTTVLLIDVDLRAATCHRVLGLEPSKGLSDCLLGEAQITDCLIHTGIGRLSFLPAGNVISNTAELITSKKMQEFLSEVKNRYPDRIIILDSLPILPFAESRALSRMVDGVMLVVRESVTYKRHLESALQQLQDVNLIGMVYNAATTIGADKEIYNLSSYAYGY